jgi:hypothetical protein
MLDLEKHKGYVRAAKVKTAICAIVFVVLAVYFRVDLGDPSSALRDNPIVFAILVLDLILIALGLLRIVCYQIGVNDIEEWQSPGGLLDQFDEFNSNRI